LGGQTGIKVSSIEKPDETNFIRREARYTHFIHLEARRKIKSSVEKADGKKFIQREARRESFHPPGSQTVFVNK
jgi:hypothetical protein